IFSGTPANDDVGALSITVTATDPAGASASSTFDVEILNTNDAPMAVGAVGDQDATEDTPFSFAIPQAVFDDIDLGDTLSYSVALADGAELPSWLAFNLETGILSGTPGNENVGVLGVSVTATDLSGAQARSTFELEVHNTNDAPIVPDLSTDLREDWALMHVPGVLLQNAVDIDPTGDVLTVVDVRNAVNGEVSIDEWGKILFIPNKDYHGPASYEYAVSDGQGGVTWATVHIDITPE